ncbi:hypothetical protein BAUCODRAFT_576260 [Baudoinia panamericana UAMH 10762]|uniref:PSP proline-rich domain-containing protein n=1 Tax=Baudoinia panamericana (strain UAMH 10762) TaxID=717646 RepID=M2MYD9_BAUPA|nr:uncharacterized protein BAUCODRAFT_576260 [Baudoinia panamericana UAMH 10762]EMC96593.1 hypothetical protein BAUCODRAFT_576260 [Baudoinia panamericana UAMH 10762]
MPGVIAEAPAKAHKPTKNAQRRAKKKQLKREVSATPAPSEAPSAINGAPTPANAATTLPDEADANHPLQPVEPSYDDPIQDVPAVSDFELEADNPLFSQFANVFARFNEADKEDPALKEPEKPEVFFDDDDNIQGEDEEEETQRKLSKKARKQANKLSIAELKAIVSKPEVVEWTDTSAQDPKLLVNIKSARNVVPVPAHWSLKREYLSSKRGIEKAGFALPKFIAETGISDMRDAVLEKQAEASLKSRQRERVQPKMGKLDIDYQKLYEAFFRRQTKPQLTRYGEVYYEGKEYETNLRHLRPGDLSEELKEALNMPPGAPPPWLINMQKIGPPPSYPALKVPGLNAPPPPGGSWGFHPGGYGKPPLDEQNRPLWGGDVFGTADAGQDQAPQAEVVDKSLWGELQPLAEEEEEEEEEDEEGDEEGDDEGKAEDIGAGMQTPAIGTATPSGMHSTVPTDFAGTHSMAEEFNLRKQRRGTETEESHHPRSAGQVLHERSIRAEGFFGGEKAYNLNPSNVPVLGQESRGSKRKAGDLDVSVDVDALEREDRLSKDEVRKQYEAQRQQGGGGAGGVGWQVDQEDLSQMIAEESAKRQKRDQERKGRR